MTMTRQQKNETVSGGIRRNTLCIFPIHNHGGCSRSVLVHQTTARLLYGRLAKVLRRWLLDESGGIRNHVSALLSSISQLSSNSALQALTQVLEELLNKGLSLTLSHIFFESLQLFFAHMLFVGLLNSSGQTREASMVDDLSSGH